MFGSALGGAKAAVAKEGGGDLDDLSSFIF